MEKFNICNGQRISMEHTTLVIAINAQTKPVYRRHVILIYLLLMKAAVFSQQAQDTAHVAGVKAELQQLWNDMQSAAVKKDRTALERFYADEFIFIHSSGQEDNKQRRIANILSMNDYTPAAMPSFEELLLYGNVAVLRVKGFNRGTTIFVKRNDQWQVMQVQSTTLPPERKAIRLDAKVLQQYVGKYEQAPGVFTMITLENDTLRAKGVGRPQVPILPLSDSVFFVKDNLGEFTFYKNDNNMVTHYILRVGGRETRGTKRSED